jgi:histidinol-phosphate/aromatic aminotransferase/cobyric acid decarboxylase-like protein/choline kinase
MQAVILTAGRGRRMEPLSTACHKALLEIGGNTILGRALDGLVKAGITTITIVTGYRSDDIVTFVSMKYPDLPVRFVHNERYASTNNIVSLALALEGLTYEEDVILIECDLLFEPHLVVDLVSHADRNVALVDHYRTGMDGTVVAVRDGYVSQVFPTSSQGAAFRYDGKFKTLNIYRFERHFCQSTLRPLLTAYASHVNANCYYELVLGMLANVPEHRIAAQVVRESDWVEVDDPNDLSVARFAYEAEERCKILDRSFGGHWSLNLLDFSLPRNAYFPPPAMVAALRHGLQDIITGYGSCQEILDEKVALFVGCDPSHIQLLSGASQAFPILGDLYSDKKIAIPSPTFGEYSRVFPGAFLYQDIGGIDWAELESLASNADMVVIVNPNNPSGTTLPTQSIYEMASRAPRTMFLVDESFLPFSDQRSIVEILEVAPLDNVAVLTSLGKVLGVPGLRLGYFYTRNQRLRHDVLQSTPIWGVNSLAEFFLELSIKFRSDLEQSIALTVEERGRMRRLLLELASVQDVHDSGGNFLLVQLQGDDGSAASALRQQLLMSSRIEVKDVSGKYTDRRPRLRLAVRTKEENDRLLEVLQDLEGEALS